MNFNKNLKYGIAFVASGILFTGCGNTDSAVIEENATVQVPGVIQGQDGLNGTPGATGARGINGAAGRAGATGVAGAAGIAGAAGVEGATGATGATGAAGKSAQESVLAKIAAYANDSTNPEPTLIDYAIAGVTGVTAENLEDVNAAVDAKTGGDVDTIDELQDILDPVINPAVIALNKIKAYADDNTQPAPTVEDYTDAGATGVTAENLADVNAAVDAKTGRDVDTVAKLQDVVTTAIGADAAAKAEVVEDIAGNANGIPATAAQINTIDGVDGAIDRVDYSDALAAGTYADRTKPTAEEIQAVVNAKNTADRVKATAEAKIAAYADDNTKPVPTVEDYADADVTGVTAENLADVNAAVDATDAAGVDTTEELQAVVDAATDAAGKKEAALNKIKAYADDNTQPAPTVEDYTDAGVTGVTAENLVDVNAAVDAKTGEEVDTDAEVQAVVDAAIDAAAKKATAEAKIAAYADDNTKPAPTVEDYADADVTGVTAENLDDVNAAVDATDAAGVDTTEEIQALVDAAIEAAAKKATAEAKIEAYADDNTKPAPTVEDYVDAGVTDVTAENLDDVNAAVDATDAAGVDTVEEIQALVDAAIAEEVAQAKIEAYADDNTKPAPTVEDYADAGVTGVTAENLDAVNASVDAVDAIDVDTKEEIQGLVDNIENALAKIAAFANDNTQERPTLEDYLAVGVSGVDEDNVEALTNEVANKTGEEVDTKEELEALLNAELAVSPDYKPTMDLHTGGTPPADKTATQNVGFTVTISEFNNAANTKGQVQFTIVKDRRFQNLAFNDDVEDRDNGNWTLDADASTRTYLLTYVGNHGVFPKNTDSVLEFEAIFAAEEGTKGTFEIGATVKGLFVNDTQTNNDTDKDTLSFKK